MSDRIRAIYEKGVFRPIDPIRLVDGETVELIITDPLAGSVSSSPDEPGRFVRMIQRIASEAGEGMRDDASVGQNHDKYLYGE